MPGAARSTSPRLTCRSSVAGDVCTTASASRGNAGGRRPPPRPSGGSRGRAPPGCGFTGTGVGPSYLGGEILARLALDRRDERTRLAIVDPDRKLFPPEPPPVTGGTRHR